jgi:hypothetical protein
LKIYIKQKIDLYEGLDNIGVCIAKTILDDIEVLDPKEDFYASRLNSFITVTNWAIRHFEKYPGGECMPSILNFLYSKRDTRLYEDAFERENFIGIMFCSLPLSDQGGASEFANFIVSRFNKS